MNGTPPLSPGPPFHWNCRSTLIPAFKSYSDLAGMKELSNEKIERHRINRREHQASMNGQVQDKMNHEEWLREQDKETRKEVLGEARWELWRKGLIGMPDMVYQNGRPLAIKELRQKIIIH